MKLSTTSIFVLFLFVGCSKAPVTDNSLLGYGPFEVKVAVSPETVERAQTMQQAVALLTAKDYPNLDALAAKLRKSQDAYANGNWKLEDFYAALDLSEEATGTEWQEKLKSLRDWVKASPDSITARVALADVMVSYAWTARSNSWSGPITEEASNLLQQRLQEAITVLAEAKPLPEHCPHWHSVNLIAALGLQVERSKFDQLFKEAIQSQPAYSGYYTRRAYFLLPQWYGKEGEWESDLKSSADELGGEAGDLLYARVVWRMHARQFYDNVFHQTQLSWPRVEKGFEVMLKSFPNSLSAKSERAYLAALALDYPKARKYFDELQGQADLTVWRTTDMFKSVARSVYANSTGAVTEAPK